MQYDFTTRVDRRGMGSSKWEDMFRKKPDVSPEVIPLSVADMELVNPPEIIEGLKAFLDTAVLGYTMPTAAYREAVASWMARRHHWTIRDEWITLSPGVVPAFFQAVKAFTEPGEGVIIQPPVYYPFAMAVEANRRVLVKNPLILENGTYRIDYEDLEAKARDPKNKLIIFCSPHNPVGRVWTKEELQKVSEICLRNRVIMVADEIHFDLIMPGAEHTVYATLSEEAARNCVVCTAPSKTFNLAGMQTSNIITPNKELREKLAGQLRENALFMLGILGLKACEIAYTQCEAWLEELLRVIKNNHELVKSYCARHIPRIGVFPLEGTYLQWLDFRSLGLSHSEQEKFMINEAEWFVDEGTMFGDEGGGFERINLACPAAALEEALERLARALKARNLL
jgi:aminotransferase/cystathionine beta-lyase